MKKAVLLALLVLPCIAVAQRDDLRAQIRADLTDDPRTAQMSPAELDALVEALAVRADADGTSGEYLESKNTFDPSSLFTPPAEPSRAALVLFSPLMLAIIFLGIVLAAVFYFIIRRGRSSPASDIS
jgi:hypothetical protein